MKRINNKYLSVFFMSAKLRLINKDMKNKQLEGFNVVLEISNTYKKVAEVFCLRYLYSPQLFSTVLSSQDSALCRGI